MRKSWKWILAIIIVLAGAWVILKKKNKGSGVEKVSIEKATKRTIIESVSTSGKIYPETEIRVSPDYSGQITELRVAEGDTVKKGQVLARVSDRGNIESSIDGIVLSLKVKKGESVTGNSFSIGTEFMTIADMSKLEVRVEVGENDIGKINIGDSADVVVDAYSPRVFKGSVTKIANSMKTASPGMGMTGDITNYEVKIRLDNNSYKDLEAKKFPFRPGMNASAEIRTRKVTDVLAVPIAAVNARVRDSDKSMDEKRKEDQVITEESQTGNTASKDHLEEVVFILQKDNTVKKVVVKTGIQDINYIEILNGLKEGDEVVTGPYSALSRNLKNGSKVKIVAKEKLFEP